MEKPTKTFQKSSFSQAQPRKKGPTGHSARR